MSHPLASIAEALQTRMADDTNSMMLTVKGRLINPLDPGEVDIEEIAHVLAMFPRYGGHTPRPWTVAKHVVLCSMLVDQHKMDRGSLVSMQALHHDDQEAIIGDWPKPIKNRIPGLAEIERTIEVQIREQFGLPADLHPDVKKADMLALQIESQYLWLGNLPESHWQSSVLRWLDGLDHAATMRAYLTRHSFLTSLTREQPSHTVAS